jgi:hypothetical protein
MRSIPQAMIWEMWRHGRWSLLLGALAANALPAMLLAALRHDGALDYLDPSQIVIHVVLVQINIMIFGAAIFAAQGSPSRLYALPAQTSSLVAWHMLPAMALIWLLSAASSAALNAVFDIDWPIWGPAMFAAVMVAAIQAAMWLTEKSGWEVVAFALVALAMGLWFKARYGTTFSQPTWLWNEVAPVEVATMLVVAVLSWFAAVAGVARNRCGDPLPSIGFIAWLNRLFDPAPDVGRPFRSAAQAQYWYEWRQKGWAMPAILVFGLVSGCSLWLIFSRTATDLFHGFLVGGGLLSMGGLISGLIMGNSGPNDANFNMGHFLATRPMTTSDMAHTIWKSAAKSVLIAWILWIVAFLALYLILLAAQVTPRPTLPRELGWWYFPATLVGAWTVLWLLASAALTGRSKLFVQLLCGLLVTSIATTLLSRFVLTRQAQAQLWHGVLVVVGVLFVLGTAWAFLAARRRALIGWPTVYVAGTLWAALSALVAVADVLQARQGLPIYLSLVGICALAVAPLATAPLALAWNRSR